MLATSVALMRAQATALDLAGKAPATAKPGWEFGLNSVMEGATSLRGGRESGTTLYGLGLAHADWSGPTLPSGLKLDGYASVMDLAGTGPTEKFVGNFLTATNIEGHKGARLSAWWLEASSDAWAVRAGAMFADEEFSTTTVGGNFINSAFGWPAFLSANTVHTGPAFYVPALGIRLKRTFGEETYAQFGIYDGDTFDQRTPDDEADRHGLQYKLGHSQGYFAIAELGFALNPIFTAAKVGVWGHSGDFEDNYADSAGRSFALTGDAPRAHRGNLGAYVSAETALVGESGKPGAVAAHVRFGAAPSDRNLIHWAADAGLAWTGPVPSRPTDTLALGFARATHSSRFARSLRDAQPGEPAPCFEEIVEAAYSAPLNEHLTIRPSLQFVRQPGGSSALRNACVLLLRVEAKY
jgi:porin